MLANIKFETDCDESNIHLHNQMELVFVLQGRATVYAENNSLTLNAEDFIIFNPFESHKVTRGEGAHTLSMYIPIQFLTKSGIGTISCVSPLQPEKKVTLDLIRKHLAQIFQNYLENPITRNLNMQAALLEILSILLQDFTDSTIRTKRNATDERKQNILRYIWENYQEPLTLSEIADIFHVSNGHLSRVFQEITGKTFPTYLREVRLIHAKEKIELGETSVTDIALSCGFGSVNSFIDAFHKTYGETPGSFIKKREYKKEQPQEPNKETNSEISYMRLLRYRGIDKPNFLRQTDFNVIEVSFSDAIKPLNRAWEKTIAAEYSKNLIYGVSQSTIQRVTRELYFESYQIHGILDDELHVCTRNEDGSLRFNFIYFDMVMNFLVNQNHIKPWIYLDYTPKCLIGNKDEKHLGTNILNLPENLDEWSLLVSTVIQHLITLYSKTEVSSWIFSMEPGVQVSFNNCDIESYNKFYKATFDAIRSALPEASITGFGLDTGHALVESNHDLEDMLIFAKENNCMPHMLTFQCFLCDYSNVSHLVDKFDGNENEVFPLSRDEDTLSKELDAIQASLKKLNISLPISIIVFNPGMWGRSPSNDTCFHATSIVKNIIENRDKVYAFCPGTITDFPSLIISSNSTYHGGSGLMTYMGTPKAAYGSLLLMKDLMNYVLSEGDGYILTTSKDKKEFSLLLYYYCPFDFSKHRTTALSPSEERNYDRYYEFEDKGSKSVRIFLKDLTPGTYNLETHIVNREHGSSYDTWMQMGAPAETQPHLNYLEYRSVFDVSVNTVNVESDGEMIISALLEPHEIRLIHGTISEIRN